MSTPVRAPLEGRVALITGAGRNIGRSIALGLAAEGADVVILVRSSREEANDVAEEVRTSGRRALVAVADVRDEQAISFLVEETREALGPVPNLRRGRIRDGTDAKHKRRFIPVSQDDRLPS